MISACVITKNEEENLPTCLAGLAWVEEIVVVDDFSTDRTEAICRRFPNVRYLTHPFGGFGPQKRVAVERATHDWVLNVDADEEVTPVLAAEIRGVVGAPGPHVAFAVRRNNLCFGRMYADGFPGAVRLFRRSAGSFDDAHVHERVVVDGPVGQLQELLLHRSRAFRDFRAHFATYAWRYGRLAAEDYEARGRRIPVWTWPWYVVLLPIGVFVYRYAVQRRYRQGRLGLYVSLSSAANYLIAHAVLARRQRSRRRPS